MKTIPAATLIRWAEILQNAETALQDAEDIRPMIAHPVWSRVWKSKCGITSMKADLMRLIVVDVAVEEVG
jgi:hypothetical protein